jgi:hypothetical protein
LTLHGHRLLTIALAVTLVKLALAAFLGGTQQVVELRAQGETLLAGEDVLDPRRTANSPSFFPMGNHLIAAACVLVSRTSGIPFVVVIKWPAILCDMGIALLLAGGGHARAGLLYLLSPVSLVLSVYHGQLHTVALLGCVLGLRLAGGRRQAGAGAALALAASVRQHFAVLLPALARGSPAPGRLLLGFAVALLAVNAPLPWMGDWRASMLRPAINYGAWGYDMLLLQGPKLLALMGVTGAARAVSGINRALAANANLLALVWPAVFAVAALVRAPRDAWRAAFVYLLGVYVFTPGVAVQWLIWAVPFFLVLEPRQARVYTVLATAFILGSYWRWTLNAAHGVYALTLHLDVLSRAELAGVVLVGALGVATWAFCGLSLLRQARR